MSNFISLLFIVLLILIVFNNRHIHVCLTWVCCAWEYFIFYLEALDICFLVMILILLLPRTWRVQYPLIFFSFIHFIYYYYFDIVLQPIGDSGKDCTCCRVITYLSCSTFPCYYYCREWYPLLFFFIIINHFIINLSALLFLIVISSREIP